MTTTRKLTAQQRVANAIHRMELSVTALIRMGDVFEAESSGVHQTQCRREELLQLAREYASAVNALTRVRRTK